MPTKYTGITIGPISSTMKLTSSPSGLWGVSYLFSSLAREFCLELVSSENAIPVENFVAPYFLLRNGEILLSDDKTDICEIMRGKGVGLFHDRIIFRSENVTDALGRVRHAREAVLNRLAENLSKDLKSECAEWLRKYLRIYAIEMAVPEEANPLIYLGKYLSAIEMEPQFLSQEQRNPLLSLFENADKRNGFKNTVLKNSFLCRELDGAWMLLKPDGDSIKTLEDISSQNVKSIERKYQKYYAVMKSDGDNMGEILRSLSSDGEIREHSRTCLSFCAQAADIILAYGGMPIYAGGDDLLALVPVVGQNDSSIFALIETLRNTFNAHFQAEQEQHDGKPTISFGVAVQYYKSPLYEALERADDMLRRAKSSDEKNDEKNACFLNLQKHSGHSIQIFECQIDKVSQNLFASLERLFQKTRQKDAKENVVFLSSAGYKVKTFELLFHEAIRDKDHRSEVLRNLFDNLFDNADQQQFKPYLAELCVLTELIFNEQEGSASKGDLARCIDLVNSAIQAIHFMNESKEED